MEGTESTTRGRTTARDQNQEADQSVLMYSKPLHRFVQREPRILGIVIVIFGCAEFLMGFHLASENVITSYKIYTPYWQGFLFIVCGSLSIYTGLHPSKKMVTVSLAMYIMSILGIVVSVGYRIFSFAHLSDLRYRTRWGDYSDWGFYRMEQLLVVEIILFISSLCVSVLLIFLCAVARLALKSTHTQIAIVIFGCAEFLMGFHLASENVMTSYKIYTPYWQGFLFIVCGSLSIYTGLHPSKKMVTVSLAMYIMSILGIIISVIYRMFSITHLSDLEYPVTFWGTALTGAFTKCAPHLLVYRRTFSSEIYTHSGYHPAHPTTTED
ncbi:hypothetical protein D5F01_LYC15634 [Larimichthys crocea]|uniref:Uncharacterized protein n=1 Tax=Larimichthys crocea TaxID=215358 RepID=A0A6G0I3B6_LARCR|nr:hypothetical protein D5F01_LYC15634 [Larimichthys crocea]